MQLRNQAEEAFSLSELIVISKKNQINYIYYIFVASMVLGWLVVAPTWIEHYNLSCIRSFSRYSRYFYQCSGTFYYNFILFFTGIFLGLVPIVLGVSQFFFENGIPLKDGGRLSPKIHALILTILVPLCFIRYQNAKEAVAERLEQRLLQSE